MSRPRRYLRALLVPLGALCVPFALAGAATATPSGTALLNACLAAAGHEASVHSDSVTTGTAPSATPGKTAKVELVTDSGTDEGVQHATFSRSGRTGRATVKLVGGVAYLRGDAFTLEYFNGFPAATALKYSNQWISFPKSSTGFSALSASLTIASSNSVLAMPSPKVLPQTKLDGYTVNRLQGKVKVGSITGTLVLSCRANGDPLPVEQTGTGGGDSSIVTFSSWSEAIRVTAPTKSIPESETGV